MQGKMKMPSREKSSFTCFLGHFKVPPVNHLENNWIDLVLKEKTVYFKVYILIMGKTCTVKIK